MILKSQQNRIELVTRAAYVKPRHAVPYALDEPTLAPTLTLSAPGGSTDNYNMDVIGSGMTLTYENFIYIALTSTFSPQSVTRDGSSR